MAAVEAAVVVTVGGLGDAGSDCAYIVGSRLPVLAPRARPCPQPEALIELALAREAAAWRADCDHRVVDASADMGVPPPHVAASMPVTELAVVEASMLLYMEPMEESRRILDKRATLVAKRWFCSSSCAKARLMDAKRTLVVDSGEASGCTER